MKTLIDVYTTGQVCRISRLSPKIVQKHFDSGRLKGYRVPGSKDRRIPRANLIAFLREHGMPLGELETDDKNNVLLIETDVRLTDRLKNLLPEAGGYRIVTADSGFEAGIEVQQRCPDTVIIDLAMGRMDALQIVRLIRLLPNGESVFVVALACEDDPAPEALRNHGCSEVVKKPFDPALLAECVRSHWEAG